MRTCRLVLVVLVVSLISATSGFAIPFDRQMPFMAGETWWCSQDWYINEPPYTHHYEPAWDFNWGTTSDDLGMPLLAPADGIIEYADNSGCGFGKVVLIKYSDGSYDRIAHCSAIAVQEKEIVKQGQVVAWCGGTGGYPVHIHFNAQSVSNPCAINTETVRPCIESSIHYRIGENTYYGRPTGCTCDYDDGQHRYTSLNSNIIDLEFNANGGVTQFGTMQQDIHWYHVYNPSSLYRSGNVPNNCYVQNWGSGPYGNCGIVYDALGGARRAYTVRTGFWQSGGIGWADLGGPTSWLGMPINNESGSEQYFVGGWLKWIGSIENHTWSVCSPGWGPSGWSPQYSYLFADAFVRNGARLGLGEPTESVDENWVSGGLATSYSVQHFDLGNRMIVYDPDNYVGNTDATNEAYYLYGNFYTAYTTGTGYDGKTLPWHLGAPTLDRVGNIQYFKYGYMVEDNGTVKAYHNTNGEIWNSADGYVISGSGGDPSQWYADHSMAMMSGDFENDGTVNDLACIYDYDDTECRIHTWCSNGSSFVYSGPTGWWYCLTGYPAEFVRHAVAGDFDGDGYKDDIAALYDYGLQANGKYRSCWHVWLGTGSSFVYQGVGPGWWIIDGYNANLVIDAVSGDFDEDGDDDIATIYDYPSDTCAIHVWLSTGSSFTYQGPQGWYYLASGYPSQNVKFMVSGDWDNDGDDDIATFYDYGWTGSAYRTRIHTWLSNGSLFVYQGGVGWWSYDGFNMDKVTQVFAGDFNADSKTDLAALYDYGWIPAQEKYQSKIHVWFSTGSAFTYQSTWWNVYGYNAQQAWYGMTGYLNADSYADLVTAYDYSDGDTTRLHVWLSTGSTLSYQGGGGWWQSFGYPLPKYTEAVADELTTRTVPESFALSQNYPNPFNASTIISYALPEASHVSIEIYNILGQRVKTLFDGRQEAGQHTVSWAADQHPSGIYFYRIQTASAVETKKMVLLR